MKIAQAGQWTLEELHNSREIVERQILDLDTRIDAAKAFASLNNAHEDPLGYADLKRKRRIRGMWHQVIAQEIGKRSKAAKAAANNCRERHFVRIAKRTLDQALFRQIMDAAEDAEARALEPQ
jgi:hypothetical protein